MSKSSMSVSRPGGFYSRPVFPESWKNSVSFGPRVFSKVVLGMEIGSFSVLTVFSLCYLYTAFLSFFIMSQ